MAVDWDLFLGTLAAFMAAAATAAGTAVEYAATPRALWLWEADEEYVPADGIYSVLTRYDGALPYATPVPTSAVQCRTVGPKNAATIVRAGALFNTLLGADGKPMRMAPVPASPAAALFRVNGIRELRAPGLIGRDEKNRPIVVFNFDAAFVPL
jgi:hypothetical protein